jgi:hypothetical protein
LAVYIYQFFMSNLESCVARSAKDAAWFQKIHNCLNAAGVSMPISQE